MNWVHKRNKYLVVSFHGVILIFDWVLLVSSIDRNLKGAASRWAANRVRAEHESKLDAVKAAKEGRPVLLTGEVRKTKAYAYVCVKMAAPVSKKMQGSTQHIV